MRFSFCLVSIYCLVYWWLKIYVSKCPFLVHKILEGKKKKVLGEKPRVSNPELLLGQSCFEGLTDFLGGMGFTEIYINARTKATFL